MARVVFDSPLVTEYDDGTEEVRFTEDEWKVMSDSPRYFGLVLQCGHALSFANEAEGCLACFAIAEDSQYGDEEAAATDARIARAPADKVVL